MKIAIWHNLPSGGGKRALFDHIQGLVDRGHTLESWCPSTADQTYLPLSGLIKENILPLSWEPRIAKNRIDEIIDPYRDVASKLAAMDLHCRQCAEQINAGGFDLLFANTSALLHVSCIGRHVNIPKVIYLQEPCRPLYEAMAQEPYRCLSADASPQLPWIALPKAETGRFTSLKRFPRDFMQMQAWRLQAREEWLSAKAFDRILVNSFFSREAVVRIFGLDAKVCYLGIDTRKFVNQHRSRENFIVGLGAIAEHKNVKFVVDSIARLPEPRPGLVWIGNAASNLYIKELVQRAVNCGVSLDTSVRVSDNELVDTLNRAMLMAYAPRLEPFGYAPLEANACGLPVVAVAEGGIRETIVDKVNGLLVEGDTQAMATAIQRLMSDHVYARQLGENGADRVSRQWSMDAAIDRLEGMFAQVLAQRVESNGNRSASINVSSSRA
jgi:glycosyltransferase involved in cell wall biosynthesis